MPNRELYNNCAVEQIIDPATTTADVDSATVDLQGYDSVMLLAHIGESGDTLSGSVKVELEVEESDDDSTWTDVADADLINFVAGTNDGCFGVIDAAAEDDATYYTSYVGDARYVRVVANLVGTHTNGIPVAATAVKGHPSLAPTS